MQPPLRRQRLGGGYRTDDVDAVLSDLRLRLRECSDDLEAQRQRTAELEGELRAARSEVVAYRAREDELSQAIENAMRRAASIEQTARDRAREIVAAAESAGPGAPVDAGLRRDLIRELRAAAESFERAISLVEQETAQEPPPAAETQ